LEINNGSKIRVKQKNAVSQLPADSNGIPKVILLFNADAVRCNNLWKNVYISLCSFVTFMHTSRDVEFHCHHVLIQKTYQFINVVNGVSGSHKTANTFFTLTQ